MNTDEIKRQIEALEAQLPPEERLKRRGEAPKPGFIRRTMTCAMWLLGALFLFIGIATFWSWVL